MKVLSRTTNNFILNKKLFIVFGIIVQFIFANDGFAQSCSCTLPPDRCVGFPCVSPDPSCVVLDHCDITTISGPTGDTQEVRCFFRDICAIKYYYDGDGDGFYFASTTSRTNPGAGWSTSPGFGGGDCNDNPLNDGALINPDTKWYLDEDGDGYYTGTAKVQCLSPGLGYVYKNIKGGNDNCSIVANPDQADKDGDGKGDACDPDVSSAHINPTNCVFSNGSITLTGLTPNTKYDLSYTYKGQPVLTPIISDPLGQYLMGQLSTGIYADITLTINNFKSDNPFSDTLIARDSPTWFSIITSDFTLCEGATMDVAYTGGAIPSGTVFQWSGPNGFLSPLSVDRNFTLLDITPANQGAYEGTGLSPDYCTDTTRLTLTVIQPTNLAIATGSGKVCETVIIDGNSDQAYTSGCSSISKFVQDVNDPDALAGVVNTCVSVEDAVQLANTQPYLQRHYDIEPQLNPATSQATITLYALQSEFDAYNAYVTSHNLALPLMPTNGVDNGNVRITQFHGTGTGPGHYSGVSELIVPGVIWNAANNWWELTFTVTGFSGFYIHSGANVLPLHLVSFSGKSQNGINVLQWQSLDENNLDRYELERSYDGSHFTKITEQGALNLVGTQPSYTYTDASFQSTNQIIFYRLKMIDVDENFSYSQIIKLAGYINGQITVFPNPAIHSITISGLQAKGSLSILSLEGKRILIQTVIGQTQILNIGSLSEGVYILEYKNETKVFRQKLIKQ